MTDENKARKKFLPVILQTIVERLKARRHHKKLTQKDVANRLGIAQSYVAKIEAGTSDFPVSRLVELCRILDLEVVLVPKHKLSTVEAVLEERALDSTNIKDLLGILDVDE